MQPKAGPSTRLRSSRHWRPSPRGLKHHAAPLSQTTSINALELLDWRRRSPGQTHQRVTALSDNRDLLLDCDLQQIHSRSVGSGRIASLEEAGPVSIRHPSKLLRFDR